MNDIQMDTISMTIRRRLARIGGVAINAALLVWFASSAAGQDAATSFQRSHKTFNTLGHPKAKGAYLTIGYPDSWAALEGNRPNIVQKFVSDQGRGFEMALILTKSLPLPAGTVVTEADKRDAFSVASLREYVPPGGTLLAAKATQIEGEPAGIVEYRLVGERVGVQIPTYGWALFFFEGTTFVSVQFSVGRPGASDQEAASRMAAFKPLFLLMANSIMFPAKWNR